MSTLRVNTIQDTSGANSSTPSEIKNGIAKSWVKFNGQGTVSILSSLNMSSITDLATGHYQINFATAFADADYCITEGHSTSSGTYLEFATNIFDNPNGSFVAPTTSSFRVTTYGQSSFRDPSALFFAIYR